ncbi:hypothetical protein EDB84DRAFT_1552799 [Lactarius hengduanensis]|nr:hypothetical protein EDB84DRAFT_1552799 [Lactarius hengduanensis]
MLFLVQPTNQKKNQKTAHIVVSQRYAKFVWKRTPATTSLFPSLPLAPPLPCRSGDGLTKIRATFCSSIAAKCRLDDPSKARHANSLALALQTKGVRELVHRLSRVLRHRRERERWSAPEILHEVPNVFDGRIGLTDAAACRAALRALLLYFFSVNGPATAPTIHSSSRRRLCPAFCSSCVLSNKNRTTGMSGQDRCQQRRMGVSVIVIDKIVEFNLKLAVVDSLEDAVSPLAILDTEDNVVFINVVLYPRDDVVSILNVRIQVQVQIVIELPLVVKLLPHHILDGSSNSPTAKSFKARGIARHMSAPVTWRTRRGSAWRT